MASLVDNGDLAEAIEIAAAHLESDVDDHYAMNAAGRAFFSRAQQTGEVDFMERAERCFRIAVKLEAGKPARAKLAELAERYRRMGLTHRAHDLDSFLEGLGR